MAASYLCGRYSAPEKIRIETKIEKQIVEVQVEKRDEEKSGEKTEVITQIIRPDGTKISRTRIEARHESNAKSEASTETKVSEKIDKTKEITNRSGVAVNILAGLPLASITHGLVYGASFTTPFFGPIEIGAWGFTDMRIGISMGLRF